MKYSINLFGYNVDCQLNFEQKDLMITVIQEDQSALKQYLYRVLPKYGKNVSATVSLQEMIILATEVENSIEGRMSEPKLKLPYEFQPEVKEKLIEAAAIQEISATKLLIRLIEKKYQEIMNK